MIAGEAKDHELWEAKQAAGEGASQRYAHVGDLFGTFGQGQDRLVVVNIELGVVVLKTIAKAEDGGLALWPRVQSARARSPTLVGVAVTSQTKPACADVHRKSTPIRLAGRTRPWAWKTGYDAGP